MQSANAPVTATLHNCTEQEAKDTACILNRIKDSAPEVQYEEIGDKIFCFTITRNIPK